VSDISLSLITGKSGNATDCSDKGKKCLRKCKGSGGSPNNTAAAQYDDFYYLRYKNADMPVLVRGNILLPHMARF